MWLEQNSVVHGAAKGRCVPEHKEAAGRLSVLRACWLSGPLALSTPFSDTEHHFGVYTWHEAPKHRSEAEPCGLWLDDFIGHASLFFYLSLWHLTHYWRNLKFKFSSPYILTEPSTAMCIPPYTWVVICSVLVVSSATSAPSWPRWNIKQTCFLRISMSVIACDRNRSPVTFGLYEEDRGAASPPRNMRFDSRRRERWWIGRHFYRPSTDVTAPQWVTDGGGEGGGEFCLHFTRGCFGICFPHPSRHTNRPVDSLCCNLFPLKSSKRNKLLSWRVRGLTVESDERRVYRNTLKKFLEL